MKLTTFALAFLVGCVLAERPEERPSNRAQRRILKRSEQEGQIWAEIEDNEQYRICAEETLPDNPCVRELFYLQGSVGAFRHNCLEGDLSKGVGIQVRHGYYPANIFPQGPQCGVNEGLVTKMTREDYEIVCEKCIGPTSWDPAGTEPALTFIENDE
ncbi:hypothetical protein CDD83_10159 [Cordyceps sp. RAO-2017]|nr:hypothetical protein CDD83_10159 [Cordyceps sp. RAO-2017]